LLIKKILIIGILFLFLGTCITPSVAIESPITPNSKGKTLYVGGTGEGNYTKIQDAIDNASDKDTVFVFDGTYYENIVMDKSIRLLGEKTNNTIIDGYGTDKNAITITADNCILEGFRVVNTSDEYWTYAGIKVLSNKNLFQNNTISFHFTGIFVENSEDNRFYDNYFDWNIVGIILNKSCKNDVSNNSFMYNTLGIQTFSNSDYNLFSYNNFNGNGIQLEKSSYNKITRNNITNNTNIQIATGGGISLYRSHYNEINNNTIANYRFHGISIELSSSNLVFRNNIIHNGFYGVYLLELSMKNVISQNNFYDNGYYELIPLTDNAFIWNSFSNHWDGNYWDDWVYRLPRIIKGRIGRTGGLIKIPYVNFDWRPKRNQYD